MKKHPSFIASTLLIGAFSASSAMGVTFLVDFNTANTTGYPNASTWNIYDAPEDIGGVISNTAGSTADNVSLALSSGTIIDSANSSLSQSGLTPSWARTGSLASAASDFFVTTSMTNTVDSFTLTYSGLDNSTPINLDIWASNSWFRVDGNFDYSVDGGTTWVGFDVVDLNGDLVTTDGWDGVTTTAEGGGKQFELNSDAYQAGRYMNISSITAPLGTVEIRATQQSMDGFNHSVGINAMRLTVIPEPSHIALVLGMGVLALGAWRRRRS